MRINLISMFTGFNLPAALSPIVKALMEGLIIPGWSLTQPFVAIQTDSIVSIDRTYAVAPNMIALQVTTGSVQQGKQAPYQKLREDKILDNGWIERDGHIIGALVKENSDSENPAAVIRTSDNFEGQALSRAWLKNPLNYTIVSQADEAYSAGVVPNAVFHKVKPIGSAKVGPRKTKFPESHTIYLELPNPLQKGASYHIDFSGSMIQDIDFEYVPAAIRSEAVHVSHLGFDPGDPAKLAFLSTWLEAGAPLDYSPGTPFWLVDVSNGTRVYEGAIELSKSRTQVEDRRGYNYNGTDVYLMDFSDFEQPGTYQVLVDGVGTSFPFEIGEKVWEDAFYVSVRGLYHQRSGIALEPPFTSYVRPRPFHPQDGLVVYQAEVSLMETTMGLNLGDLSAFEALADTKTDVLLPDAWGGWFDAGDWDRRSQHLTASRLLLELANSNPSYFERLDLTLPESDNQIPDVIDEALWGLAVFKRLQQEAGGVPGGIESAAHPKQFEASWQESQTVMAYGPGLWSSYLYAGVAARAAYTLRKYGYDLALASEYAQSAERAMLWAEAEYPRQSQAYQHKHKFWKVEASRNLAAAELYRLTAAEKWHALFLETTAFTDPDLPISSLVEPPQADAAFVYAQTSHRSVDRLVQANARQALLAGADTQIEWINRTGFKWYKHPEAPVGWGALGAPNTLAQIRAHRLSGDVRYLRAAVMAAQFSAGANPDNVIFTTGLGHRSPRDPLVEDARATGAPPPPGITVFGPIDTNFLGDYWIYDLFADSISPWPTDWPVAEGYIDVYHYIPVNEFTVNQTIAPTAFTWGYLAAVDEENP